MASLRVALLIPGLLSSFSAGAEDQPLAVARATIERVSPDADRLVVRTRAGQEQTIRLSAKTTITLVLPATLAEVQPGRFHRRRGASGRQRGAEGDGGARLSRGDARDGRGSPPVRPRPGQHHDQRRGRRAGRRRRRLEPHRRLRRRPAGHRRRSQDSDRILRAGRARGSQGGGGARRARRPGGRRDDRRNAHFGRQGRPRRRHSKSPRVCRSGLSGFVRVSPRTVFFDFG